MRGRAIGQSLEEQFAFLMRQLKIDGHQRRVVARFVDAVRRRLARREAEIVAAGGTITAAERRPKGSRD